MENKYQRGKIYKIVSNSTKEVYYGSTVEKTLSNRLAGHRSHFKIWLYGNGHYISSFEILKHHDEKIVLVENFPCNTKYELCAREQYYIDTNDCVNKLSSCTGLTISEYRRKYHVENREIILQRVKEFYKK